MQCIVVKNDEFENLLPLYIFPLNPDYVAARSLRSLRSNDWITIMGYCKHKLSTIKMLYSLKN